MAQGSPQNTPVNVGVSDASPTTIVAARAGYAIRVMGYVLVDAQIGAAWPDGANSTVQWVDDSTSPPNPLTGVMPLRPALPLVAPVAAQTGEDAGGWFQTASGANLQLLAGSPPISGHLTWCWVAQ